MWSIIVHGGAGKIDPVREAANRQGCSRAAEAGASILRSGGRSLDAVCAAIHVLEDDPEFNAGVGGALDERGLVAHDASLMRGSDLAYGAVGAVVGVKNVIDLARAVLEDGRHCLLVGPSALRFARGQRVALCDPALFETPMARAEWNTWAPELAPREKPEGDTVGAVALDGFGDVAAGTSTGGLTARYAGRVGDAPIAGAGTYARSDLGGISATGHGETMLRTVLAYQALISLKDLAATVEGAGGSMEVADDDSTSVVSTSAVSKRASLILARELDLATRRVGGRGGLISVLSSGRVAWARNAQYMGVAWMAEGSGAPATDF